ncbi:TrmH family RNA methyltransferase [Ileibacterium valens]|uniref:TrmH family RNA methyltransferase n=1 Tax=Ileibacterium valens TaxID=1862668 RepID=UPI00257390DA|nr:TrmH family RNA methyltransferase [Ileibacterium valens]
MDEKKASLSIRKPNKEDFSDSDIVIYTGGISCKAVLENRPQDCRILYVNQDKRSKDFAYIISLAKRNHVQVTLLGARVIQEQFPNCGGIALIALPRKLKKLNLQSKAHGLIIYLSGLEDPYNLGSSIRSLYAAGCSQVILNERDWSWSNPVILKASAGAWEKMNLSIIANEDELIEFKKLSQIPMFCASRKDPVSLFDYSFEPTVLGIIGGALRGISPKLENACDHRICIPYGNDFRNALDTPSAAAVFAFSWLRDNPDFVKLN